VSSVESRTSGDGRPPVKGRRRKGRLISKFEGGPSPTGQRIVPLRTPAALKLALPMTLRERFYKEIAMAVLSLALFGLFPIAVRRRVIRQLLPVGFFRRSPLQKREKEAGKGTQLFVWEKSCVPSCVPFSTGSYPLS
jgi:hypothetical protein